MIRHILFTSLVLLAFTSCQKDETISEDPVICHFPKSESIDPRIFGNWEIYSRLENGISDLSALCCEFIEFSPSLNGNHQPGIFKYSILGEEYIGTFEMNPLDSSLLMKTENRSITSQYILSDSILTINYFEDKDISESWIRR